MDTTAPHENQPAGTAWSRLIAHASEPRFLAGASVFRIVAGLTFVYQLLSVYAQRRYLFGPGGVYPFDLFLKDVGGASFSLYSWSDSLLFFEVVYHASIAVAFLWLFGWRARVLTPLLWALIWSVRERNPLLWDGGDNVMQLALIYACLVDVSARFSFDAIRRGRDPRPMSPAAAMAHNAGVLACAIQISLVYGVAGLMKVQGETWRNGTALYYALRGGEFTWPGYSELIFENSALLAALAYATVAFQVSFTFLLFLGRRLRVLAVLAGLSFHFGIMSMMALVSFGAFMMAVDLMFVTDGEYAAVGRAVRRLRSGAVGLARWALRIGRAVPAPEMQRSPLQFARALVHRRRVP